MPTRLSWQGLIDWVAPSALQEDAHSYDQARGIAGGVIIGSGFGVLYTAIYLLDGFRAAAYANMAMVLLILCSFVVLRFNFVKTAANIVVFALFQNLFVTSLTTGGDTASSLPWFAFVPVVAVYFTGIRNGMIWGLASLLPVIGFYVAEAAGHAPPALVSSTALDRMIDTLALIACIGMTFAHYENYKQKAMTEIEQARKEAEAASRTKSAFLANMSHEVRTPLNAILGYARLLQRRPGLDLEMRQPIDTIEAGGAHLLALINDILDLSKVEAGQLKLEERDFDLKALVDEIEGMFWIGCREKDLGWQGLWATTRDTPDFGGVYGDEGKLRQVLINLVGNAVKFTDRGSVCLRITPIPASAPPAASNRYRFEVIDTGPGIRTDEQAEIFEPFEQGRREARVEGTGLGLAIARRYIELMGGELSLESEPGAGALFLFTLPLVPSKLLKGGHPAEPAPRVMGLAPGCRVAALVVDDVSENREVLSLMLAGIGVVVRTAADGREALEALEEGLPDVVLMDIWMPVMDGLEAVRAIRERYGEAAPALIAVSASALPHELKQFLGAGFDAFLPKPIEEEQVFAYLAKYLQVEYVYEDAAPSLNLKAVVLPEELFRHLRTAAEFGDVDELEGLIDEVRGLGAEACPLADHLGQRMDRFELDAILKLLEEVRYGER